MHDFNAHYEASGLGAVLLNFSIVLILFGYLVIAFQFWLARRPTGEHRVEMKGNYLHVRARRAFFQLLLIFILCGLSGYMPRLIQVPINLFITTHVLLALATWWYILSRQAVVIAEAMSSRDRP